MVDQEARADAERLAARDPIIVQDGAVLDPAAQRLDVDPETLGVFQDITVTMQSQGPALPCTFQDVFVKDLRFDVEDTLGIP